MNKFRSSLSGGKGPRDGDPLVRAKRSTGALSDAVGSVAVPRGETRTADHRDGDRHRLASEIVQVRYAGQDHDATLINLSGGGAMISSRFMPRLWDRVDLTLGEGSALECAVRWIRGDRLGLEFAHETAIDADPATRDGIVLDTIRRTFPDAGMTPAAEPLAEPEAAPAADIGDNHGENRGERRHPLIWSGTVLYSHDSHPARLRNISTTGALVECVTPLPEGAEVLFDLGNNVQQFARVGWTRGEQSGLIFTTPFDLARLSEARPEVAPQRWARPGFLDLATQESPWAKEWGRQTVDELRANLEGFLRH